MLPGIAIFGNGPLVQLLVRYLRANGFRKIEAIWAPTAEQAAALATEHQIPVSSSVIDKILLLPSVQLIIIASAPHFHSQIATKACGIGKHVLCSNPPAYSLPEMRTMRNAASNYPALITLIFTSLRFIPAFQLMRKLIIEDKLIGPVRTIQGSVLCDVFAVYEENGLLWDKFMGGGLLSLYGTNLIDIISYTTGLRARKVHSIIRTFNQLTSHHILHNNADDYVSFQMEMFNPTSTQENEGQGRPPDTVIANVILNGLQYSQLPEHELIVYGANGYLSYRNGNLYGKLRQTTSSASPIENGHGSLSSGQESVTSLKESIFYLSNLDDSETTAVGEGSSAKLSSLGAASIIKSHVWPEVYQRGIYSLIVALREAFFGHSTRHSQADDEDSSCSGDQATVHSMACLPSNMATSSQPTSLNSNSGQPATQQIDEIHWIKEPVSMAASFDEGLYIQTVIEAIKQSSDQQQWARVDYAP